MTARYEAADAADDPGRAPVGVRHYVAPMSDDDRVRGVHAAGLEDGAAASTAPPRSGPRRSRSPCSPRSSATTRSGCTTTSTTCPGRRTRRCSSAGRRSPRSASCTSRIRLGQMVGCNSYRNPALLAKITSTVDVISGGRLDWGIGAGWYENEYRGYGYEFPKPKDRIGMLRETRRDRARSCGPSRRRRTRARTTSCRGPTAIPKPLQVPHPPIWIGGGGEQLTLRVVARHADCSNFGGKPGAVGAQARRPARPLRGRRSRPRRDPHDVVARGVHPRDRGRGRRRRVAQPVGRAGRAWRAGQPRRHARAGRREDPDLRRPRLSRVHPVVRRLPRHRDAGRCSRPR